MMHVVNTIMIAVAAFLLGMLIGLKLPDYSPHPRPAACQCNGHCGWCK